MTLTTRGRVALLAPVTIAILAYLALTPDNPHRTALVPLSDVPALTVPDTSCDLANLSVQPDYSAPADLPYRYWSVYDGPNAPHMTVTARTADDALRQAETGWADSFGEMSCSK